MRKALATSVIMLSLLFVGRPVFAEGGNVHIRLEEPKTPTKSNEFDIAFVVLDTLDRPITVTCYKKGPDDTTFVQMGAAKSILTGGNTGVCSVTSSAFNRAGTFTVKAVADAGADTASDAVTIDYMTGGPGDPVNYGKEKLSSCEYKIKFRSADDSGKTVKIEVYRSDSTSFTADAGTRIASVTMGSNTDGSITSVVSACDKPYYFAVRAFDSAGNGSGLVGDSEIKVTTTGGTTTTTTGTTQGNAGAVPVAEGQGNVNRPQEGEGKKTEGSILGESTPSAEVVNVGKTDARGGILGVITRNPAVRFGLILLALAAIIAAYTNRARIIGIFGKRR